MSCWWPPKPLPPSPRPECIFITRTIRGHRICIIPGSAKEKMTDEELADALGITEDAVFLQQQSFSLGELAESAPLWKAMCDGCGAPLQRIDIQCSYCRRATGVVQPSTMTMTSPGPISDETAARLRWEWTKGQVSGGHVTVNEARAQLRLQPLTEWNPDDDPSYGGDPRRTTSSSGPK